MSDALSAVAFRIMGARDRLTGTPRDSLENIITNPLPDGSLCWVTSVADFYVLLKTSIVAADGVNIIEPIGGPGRWFRYNYLVNAARSVASINFNSVAGVTLDAVAINTASRFLSGLSPLAGWTLNNPQFFTMPTAGILNYTGTITKRLIVTVHCSIAWTSTPTGPFSLLIGQRPSGGALAALANSEALIEAESTSTGIAKHVTARMSVLLAPGDQLEPMYIDRAASLPSTFVVHSLALAVGD